jgi:hypothetical protein
MIVALTRGVAPNNFVTTGFNPLKGDSENTENHRFGPYNDEPAYGHDMDRADGTFCRGCT